jgi:hypothetical protein
MLTSMKKIIMMAVLVASLVPTLVMTTETETEVSASGADCSHLFNREKGHYDGNYQPQCDFANADAKAGDSVPKCDGSYQDCYTEDGFFCEAGSGEHYCEVEEPDNDNGDEDEKEEEDDE